METDIKELNQAIKALERINQPELALVRIRQGRQLLENLLPYVRAGLAELPLARLEFERFLTKQEEYWNEG